jgi:glycosyltransferase involved in cell wall biosynthesis
MNVLVITGDKKFGPGHLRYELQRRAVDSLEVVYWGRGSIRPALPAGPFDVVTAQDPFWRGLYGWYAAKKYKARFNVQVHTDLSAASFLHRTLARIVLRLAHSVRVVSEKIKGQVKHPHITILPIYVDASKFKTIVRNPEGSLVLWVGRFEPEKDPLYALDVLRGVPGAKLVMLGAGSLEPILRHRAAELPVGFAGWQDPVPYLIRASAVLCTSRHESFGASMVEALAAGVPVVAPDVGIAKEAGAIVVPREKLAEAVTRVLRTKPEARLALTLPRKEEWAEQWKKSLQ